MGNLASETILSSDANFFCYLNLDFPMLDDPFVGNFYPI